MQEFTIDKNEAGQRMDKYLNKLLKNAPSSFVYKMLRKKNITLNGKKAAGTEILAAHDTVRMFFSEETFEKFSGFSYQPGEDLSVTPSQNEDLTSENDVLDTKNKVSSLRTEPAPDAQVKEYLYAYRKLSGIKVVYEDSDVLILNKPMNVLSQKADKTSVSANEWMIGYLLTEGKISKNQLRTFKPSVVNRLDRNTTGLLLCGISLKGTQCLSECVRNRTVEKYYLTIVGGVFAKEQNFSGFLCKNEQNNKVTFFQKKEMIPAKLLKEAAEVKTGFEPVDTDGSLSLVKVHLYTGKTHQIRAHLASLGYPVLGDPKYGNKKLNEKFHEKVQLLHAYRLEFPSLPGMEISEKTITCELPKSFQKYHFSI